MRLPSINPCGGDIPSLCTKCVPHHMMSVITCAVHVTAWTLVRKTPENTVGVIPDMPVSVVKCQSL